MKLRKLKLTSELTEGEWLQELEHIAALAMRANVAPNVAAVEVEIERSLDLIVYISRQNGKRAI